MASKILKGAGKLLGIGGKKKAAADPAAAAPVEQKGPIIKQLGAEDPVRRRTAARRGPLAQTLLSDKLGS